MTLSPVMLAAVRVMYTYHFALYERMWDSLDTLTDAQFVQPVPYSIGALRNHVIHLASVEQRWLARVTGDKPPERLIYEDYSTRAAARTVWDTAMARVQAADATAGTPGTGRKAADALRAAPARGGLADGCKQT